MRELRRRKKNGEKRVKENKEFSSMGTLKLNIYGKKGGQVLQVAGRLVLVRKMDIRS